MNEQTDATLATVGKVATYVSGGTAFLGGMSANDVAALAGVVGVVAGLLIQWYYTRRKDRREAERDRREAAEHAARMEGYRNGRPD